MNDLVRQCSKGCGRKLNAANKTGICTPCQKPNRYKSGSDDSVLSRMGFRTQADEAPPRRRSRGRRAKPRAKPEPTHVPAAAPLEMPEWEGKFFSLALALGLDPRKMLEDHCRGWVQETRARALAPAPKQLPAGELGIASRAEG